MVDYKEGDSRTTIETAKYMGIQLIPEKLLSKDALLCRLEGTNVNHSGLEEIRDEYSDVFGKDIVWNYPLDDDLHTGFMFIPVKEGFLSLPYNEVRKGTFEEFLLDEAKLFDLESLRCAIDSWNRYSEGLIQALTEAKTIMEGK